MLSFVYKKVGSVFKSSHASEEEREAAARSQEDEHAKQFDQSRCAIDRASLCIVLQHGMPGVSDESVCMLPDDCLIGSFFLLSYRWRHHSLDF